MAPEESDRLGVRQRCPFSLFGAEEIALNILPLKVFVGICCALGCCPDRELKAFYGTIPKLAGPHDIFGSQHRHNYFKRHEVSIAPYFNRLGGTYLDA